MFKYPQDPEAKAFRKTIWTAIISFIAGFILSLVLLAWIFTDSKSRWWDIYTTVCKFFELAVISGLCIAFVSVWILDKYYYWRGVHCCPFCRKPIKGANVPCDCAQAQALKKQLNQNDEV
jgi:hypothetical protein